MRWILLLAALLALATSLWLLRPAARPAGEALVGPATPPPPVQGPGEPAWARLKTGTLHVLVRARDGSVPLGTQVGFATPRGPRLYYVDGDGQRTLSDLPLGDVSVVVQAPGHPPQERRTRVEAGVVGQMVFELGPPPAAPAPAAPGAAAAPGGPASPAPR